jgi:16S rRNA (cytosine1402-N4)-methyltransferase
MNETIHLPVLMAEVLEALAPRDGETIVDGTFGGGGYTRAILRAANCKVIGFDRDPAAIARGKEIVREFPGRLTLINGTFGAMREMLTAQGVEAVDGIVLDLGVSSDQLEVAERGFSIQHDGPLDMRMGDTGISAAGVVNSYSEQALAGIIYVYGEELKANAVARAIVAARGRGEITRTGELASICARAVGRQASGIHPATRTFQALRIAVNQELKSLRIALERIPTRLAPGGRLAVISFHSLEDRLVKEAFRNRQVWDNLTKSPVEAGPEEVSRNPRSRSAKLRAAQVISAPPAAT